MESNELILFQQDEGMITWAYRNFPLKRANLFFDLMARGSKHPMMLARVKKGILGFAEDINAKLERSIGDTERYLAEIAESGDTEKLKDWTAMCESSLSASKEIYAAVFGDGAGDSELGEPSELAFGLNDMLVTNVPLDKADLAAEFFERMHKQVLTVYEVYRKTEDLTYRLDTWLQENHRQAADLIEREKRGDRRTKRIREWEEDQRYYDRIHEQIYGVPILKTE